MTRSSPEAMMSDIYQTLKLITSVVLKDKFYLYMSCQTELKGTGAQTTAAIV